MVRTIARTSTLDEVTDATRVIHRYEHDLYNARNLDLVEEMGRSLGSEMPSTQRDLGARAALSGPWVAPRNVVR